MKIYLVGGAVRDHLLGLPVTDRDWVVTGATVEDMLAARFLAVGKDFPVFLHPQSKEEYALARTERKSGAGHTGFVVHTSPDVTLEEDLRRRDLTINAMAEAPDGTLIDPSGGRADLERRVLRHVSAAFAEDPLRILRVARFAARLHGLGFSVAPETLDLMRAMTASGELASLVPERVWQEMELALASNHPQVFFQVLRECGALACVLPEIDRLFGVPQPARYHPEIDTGLHTLMVLEQAALLTDNTVVRFAALVHDLGKALTPAALWPLHTGHEELGAGAVSAMGQRLRIPNEHVDLGRLVSLQHTRCHRADRHGPEDLYTTLELTDALRRPERFELFLRACEADARGRLGLEAQPYPQAAVLRQALAAAREAPVKALVQAHPDPRNLVPAIRQARIAAIASHLPAP